MSNYAFKSEDERRLILKVAVWSDDHIVVSARQKFIRSAKLSKRCIDTIDPITLSPKSVTALKRLIVCTQLAHADEIIIRKRVALMLHQIETEIRKIFTTDRRFF